MNNVIVINPEIPPTTADPTNKYPPRANPKPANIPNSATSNPLKTEKNRYAEIPVMIPNRTVKIANPIPVRKFD